MKTKGIVYKPKFSYYELFEKKKDMKNINIFTN